MNGVVKFFHELMNPHCEHCSNVRMQELEQKEIEREIEEASKICQSCENLKMQLAVMNQLVNKLTDTRTESVTSVEPAHHVIQPARIPWHVKRQELELKSRLRAEELRAESSVKVPVPDTIEKLEEKLGIGNGTEAISN